MRRVGYPFAVVILQSDDWGFSGWTFGEPPAMALGYAEMGPPFSQYGFSGLEKEADLENVFTTLESITDAAGLPAIIQANYIVAAPDYGRIAASGGREWYAIELPLTPPYWHQDDIVQKALEGISRGVWRPEYHGYSHCDISRVLKLVRTWDPLTQKSFELNCLPLGDLSIGCEYASDFSKYVKRGLYRFQKLFGYRAISSAPPNYYLSFSAMKELRRGGVKVIQGIDRVNAKTMLCRFLIRLEDYISRAGGKWNVAFTYSPRDLDFEPRGGANDCPDGKHWEIVLRKARELLKSRGLIGISMHRLNFVHHSSKFSRENLKQLAALLQGLVNTVHGLVFLTDNEYLQFKRHGFSISKRGNAVIVRNLGNSEILGYFPEEEFPELTNAIRHGSGQSVSYRGRRSGHAYISILPGNHRFES